MIKVGVYGANGRMGRMIIECLKESEVAKFSVGFDRTNDESLNLAPNLDKFFKSCDVIIDFTLKDGTIALLNHAKNNPKPLCIGTTGLGEDGMALLKECSLKMPVLYATNMSLGVAVLNKLASLASKALREFDIEIVEMHHKHKKDAPSGTALTLAECVSSARELNLKDVMITGRAGDTGARRKDEIAVVALRGGDIVGRHTAGFYSDGEFIELNHTATSRATFANGAIKAALWLKTQKPGLYTINDCLGL